MYYEFRNKLSGTECHKKVYESMIHSSFGFRSLKGKFQHWTTFSPSYSSSLWAFKANHWSKQNVSTWNIVLELNIWPKTIVNTLKWINLMFKFNSRVLHKSIAESRRKKPCLVLLIDQSEENILHRTVICDVKWVYYNNASCKGV